MSLHRVGSMSSYEQIRGSSPARSERRYMSFNPVGKWVSPPRNEEPLVACDVFKARKILQVSTAIIYSLFSAGVVFGYAAIKPILVNEGVYREHCPSPEYDNVERTCYEQEIRLNFIFTAAAVATNVFALPVGMLLDKYGPRISGLIGSVLIAIGAILLAFAVQLPFDGYISGYIFLALGGPFVFISSFQLSNTFPNHSGLILALLTGAFDSSSAIFLFYRLAYKASNQKISLQKFFLAYLSVPIFIFFVQIFLMPSKSYKTIDELATYLDGARSKSTHQDQRNGGGDHVDQSQSHRKSLVSEVTSLLERSGGDTQEEQEDHKKATSGVWGALHGLSALQQIRTLWFALIAIFTIVQMTRMNYFVATIRTQYIYILHSNVLAEHINNFFDVALPLGGVVSIPFIGLILDNASTPFVLALLVATATVIGILGVLPFTWAAYANIAIFVIYRPFYYTAISDYAAKVFGFHTFGKVYGLIICLAGLFNFSQSALDAATHQTFHSNPTPVNVIMIVISLVVGLVLFSYVWHKSKLMARGSLEDEAEDATETVVPGTNRNEHN